jgi:hypothetical protein
MGILIATQLLLLSLTHHHQAIKPQQFVKKDLHGHPCSAHFRWALTIPIAYFDFSRFAMRAASGTERGGGKSWAWTSSSRHNQGSRHSSYKGSSIFNEIVVRRQAQYKTAPKVAVCKWLRNGGS